MTSLKFDPAALKQEILDAVDQWVAQHPDDDRNDLCAVITVDDGVATVHLSTRSNVASLAVGDPGGEEIARIAQHSWRDDVVVLISFDSKPATANSLANIEALLASAEGRSHLH